MSGTGSGGNQPLPTPRGFSTPGSPWAPEPPIKCFLAPAQRHRPLRGRLSGRCWSCGEPHICPPPWNAPGAPKPEGSVRGTLSEHGGGVPRLAPPRVSVGAAPTPGPSRRIGEVAGAAPAASPRLLKHRGWVRGGGGGWRVQGGGRGGFGGQPDPAIQRSEEVCLNAVWFPMEGGEDAGEGSRHSLGGLPGLQQLGRVGGTAAAPHPCPEGRLEGLGGMAGSQGCPRTGAGAEAAAGAADGSSGQGGRAVGSRAAVGFLGFVVFGRGARLRLLPGAAGAAGTLGIGRTLLLAEFGSAVLEPHLEGMEGMGAPLATVPGRSGSPWVQAELPGSGVALTALHPLGRNVFHITRGIRVSAITWICEGDARGGKWGGDTVTLHPSLHPVGSEPAPQPSPQIPTVPTVGCTSLTLSREGGGRDPHSCGSLHSYGDGRSDKGAVCTLRGGSYKRGLHRHRETPQRGLCTDTGGQHSQRRVCTHTGVSALTPGTSAPTKWVSLSSLDSPASRCLGLA